MATKKPAKPRTAKVPRKSPRPAPAKQGVAKKRVAKKAPPEKAPARKTAAFGRPGTAGKAEGDAAVRAWVASVKPEHRPIVERLDALVAEVVPDVKRAIKWSMPMYGRTGTGFFASVASFKDHVGFGFFAGATLEPPPPLGEGKDMRRVKLRSMADVDERLLRSWIAQAASRPGWGKL